LVGRPIPNNEKQIFHMRRVQSGMWKDSFIFHLALATPGLEPLIENQNLSVPDWLRCALRVDERPRAAAYSQSVFLDDRKVAEFKPFADLIDDFRLCWLQPGTCPRPSDYVRWAKSNGLNWTIQQDILCQKP